MEALPDPVQMRAEAAKHAKAEVEAHVLTLETKIEELEVAPLYRGVRGELPNSFWVADEQGLVCATDTAFMSTSRNRKTPIEYMGGGTNVLWELEPKVEDDTAYHNGAGLQQAVLVNAGERRRRPGRAAGGGDARGGQVVRCDPRRARVRVGSFS